jgi:hypothetical protein
MSKLVLKIEDYDDNDWEFTLVWFDNFHDFVNDWNLYINETGVFNSFYLDDNHAYELKKNTTYKFIRVFFRNYIQFNNSIIQYLT